MDILGSFYTIVRGLVAVAFAWSLVVALVYWAVRRGRLKAFGWPARAVRATADPVLRPLERRVIRFGGNPQDAPIWLIGLVVLAGLLLLALVRWAAGFALYLRSLSHSGPRAWIGLVVNVVYTTLIVALLVRVIGSWFGIGRYHRVGRWAYRLTDWIVEPIRRALPPFGFIDLSPLVAWFLLWLGRLFIGTVLL